MRQAMAIILFVSLAAITIPAQSTHYTFDNQPGAGSKNAYPFALPANWRYQVLVTPSRMPNVKIRISDVAVATSLNGTWTAQSMLVRMNTTLSTVAAPTFGQNLGQCPITVFNGVPRVQYANDRWSDLGLQHSFVYDGTASPKRSLVIDFCMRNSKSGPFVRTVALRTDASRAWLRTNGDPCQATTGMVDPGLSSGAPKLRLTYDTRGMLVANETIRLSGENGKVTVEGAPGGDAYQIATAFSDKGVLTIGKCTIALAVDDLFAASVQGGSLFFARYAGTVSAQGTFDGRFRVPRIPALTGVCLFHAAICFNRGGISCCTNTAGTTIIP